MWQYAVNEVLMEIVKKTDLGGVNELSELKITDKSAGQIIFELLSSASLLILLFQTKQ